MIGTVENYLLMTGTMLPRKKVYDDSLTSWYIYYCDAAHWAALTDSVWRIVRGAVDANGNIEEVWETDGYDNLATDLATVAALSYS